MTDYYEILGVSKDASKDDIKKAYKRLAKKFHPDLNKGNSESEKKFKELNEAASVLLDDNKRAQYDQFGSTGPSGQGFGGFEGMGGFGGFEDIFESFFGGMGGSRRRRGADLLYPLEITLEEAAFGVEKNIEVTKHDICKTCSGRGYEKDSDASTCSTCHGTGRITRQQQTPFGMFQTQTTCPQCRGQGIVIDKVCGTCSGAGKQQTTKTIAVSIPAGIESGQRLRVAGEGEAGDQGAPTGDLYVEITVLEHDVFERDGNDIITRINVSYAQATLGDEITVPTLKSSAKLKIPVGTQSGTMFKMKGKGISNLRGFGAGDEFVRVEVEVPTKLSKKQKELLESFDKSLGNKKPKARRSIADKIKEALG